MVVTATVTITALTACVYVLFFGLLALASVADLRTLRIPDGLIGALFVVWFAWRAIVHVNGITDAPISFSQGILGAIMLGGGLLVVTTVYEMITHKRAMGGGDIKLLAVVGLYLGATGGLFCLMVACATSLVMSLVLPRLGWKRPQSAEELHASNDVDGDGVPDPAVPILLKDVPFGPAIAVGSLVTVMVAVF